jgi:excisionase family DNA binding protein
MNDYLTQPETAQYLRLSPRTVERMRIEGRGPRFTRAGRRVIYARSGIDSWLAERTYQSTSESAA